MTTLKIDLNSDIGESFGRYKLGHDEEILKYISSANIACGFHAGDPSVMKNTVKKAIENGVKIGAHPGYNDLQGFGRRSINYTPQEVYDMLLYQIGALYAFTKSQNTTLRHIKPHGALYNDIYKNYDKGDKSLAEAVASAIKDFDENLIAVMLAGTKVIEYWQSLGLKVAGEVFADRAYTPDGKLVPRSQKGAVIHDEKEVVKRVLQMVEKKQITAIDGSIIKQIEFDTICLHGDTKGAVELAQKIHNALKDANIKIIPMLS